STTQRVKEAFKTLAVFEYLEKYPEHSKAFDDEEFLQKVNEAVSNAEHRLQSFVFVLMPFAEKYVTIYQHIIKESIESEEIPCIRADDFFEPRRIMDDVKRCIQEARLIVADLSGRNPNVFYEVGMAHSIGQTVLLLSQSIADVPPKLSNMRNILY